MKSSAKKKRRGAKKKRPLRRDSLSDLPDAILGHVLSFLPAEEASRATVLSRRWRNAFADVVHTISFRTPASCLDNSSGSNRDQTVHGKLLDQVTAALVARRRHGGGGSEEAQNPCFVVDDVPDVLPVRCLRERVREISVEQYEGAKMQRMLLKALLREALVLESVGVVFASGRCSLDVLVDEIKSWPSNPATRVTLQTL